MYIVIINYVLKYYNNNYMNILQYPIILFYILLLIEKF